MARADICRIDPLIGRTIASRYRVEHKLTEGGVGSVYEAVHLQLGRRVAVKVLSGDFAQSPEAVERFRREARIASRIDHPNIVNILDLGCLETGEPFLVMELLVGGDLRDFIDRQGPLSPRRVAQFLLPISRALDVVHANGQVHRDIKPANIFLAELPDGTTAPKLVDFGLAALRAAPENERRLTREGMIVGTPQYVSPEAAEGAPVDHRADIYALGLIVYELLTGQLPFDSDAPMMLLYAKVRRPAPTMGERTGKRFDDRLERLVARCLSRSPHKRPGSAGELIRSLGEIGETLADSALCDLEDVPVAEAPRAGDRRPENERPMRASSESIGLPLVFPAHALRWVVAAALALVLGVTAWAWQGEANGPSDPTGADDALARAAVAESAAQESVAQESGEGAGVDGVERAEPNREGAEAARSNAHDELDDAPEPRPRARTRAPRPAVVPRPIAATAPTAAAVGPGEPAANGVRDPVRALSLSRDGNDALLRGRFPDAAQLYRRATYSDTTYSPAWRGIGLASERMGHTEEAIVAYRRYLALAPRASDAAAVRHRIARLSPAP